MRPNSQLGVRTPAYAAPPFSYTAHPVLIYPNYSVLVPNLLIFPVSALSQSFANPFPLNHLYPSKYHNHGVSYPIQACCDSDQYSDSIICGRAKSK